jgi:putative addiction module component (TIGR02574 family)
MAIDVMFEEAMRLSDDERTELVVRLLDAFEEAAPVDPGREAAWTEVIDRRLQEARDGRATLVDADEAVARVRAAVLATRR